MDAGIGPVGFPVIQVGLGLFQAFEAFALERRFLAVAYPRFDFAFAIGILNSARQSDHGVVSQNIAEQGIERGIIDIRFEYAFFQVVQHDGASATAESTKGFLVELGPNPRAGAEGQQAYSLAAVTQGHDE